MQFPRRGPEDIECDAYSYLSTWVTEVSSDE
jgi:hypothetical protein